MVEDANLLLRAKELTRMMFFVKTSEPDSSDDIADFYKRVIKEDIMDDVCETFNVSIWDMKRRVRKHNVVYPRQIFHSISFNSRRNRISPCFSMDLQ